jgi:hypothetical protein
MMILSILPGWDRALLALLMVLVTIVACVGLWALTVIKGRFK